MKELTFHRLLVQTLEQRGQNTAFIEGDVREPFADHVDRTLRLVDALSTSGLRRGDRIAVVADASRQVINVLHAAALGGFIAVPLNVRLGENELAAMLADCDPAVIAVDERHLAAVTVATASAQLSPIVMHLQSGTETPPEAAFSSSWGLEELVEAGAPRVPDEPDEDQLLLMLYTGGTTGRSRGALCSNRQLALSLQRMQTQMDVRSVGATMLSVNPLYHIGALNAAYAFPAAGSTVVLRPSFRPEQVLLDAAEHHITHLPAVVSVLQMILEQPGFRPAVFATLRYIIYGASPMPRRLLGQLIKYFPGAEIQQSYGLTEAFGGVTYLSGPDHKNGSELSTSIGRALPGIVVTIRDPSGVALPHGTIGELCVASGSATTRFWRQPDPSSDQDWLQTGDLGWQDDHGYVYLVDRLKDMIKSGGENVYSNEVETVLAMHPDVDAVAVIGIPDTRWGEAVHAEVVLRPSSVITAEDIITFAKRFLSGYKVPKSITIRDQPLPLSAIGKVLKHRLREEWR